MLCDLQPKWRLSSRECLSTNSKQPIVEVKNGVTHVFAVPALGFRAFADSGVERHRHSAHPGCNQPVASCYRSTGAAFRGTSIRSGLLRGDRAAAFEFAADIVLARAARRRRHQDHDSARGWFVAIRLLPLHCCYRDRGRSAGDHYLVLSRRLAAVHRVKGKSLLDRVVNLELRRIRRRGPLPYGVAIAAGGTFVLLHTGGL